MRRNRAIQRAKHRPVLDLIDRNRGAVSQVGTSDSTYAPGDYPWRDRDDPLFTPQPMALFLKEQMGITLFPKQQYDMDQLMGTDPKRLFERNNGLPEEGVLCYGKGSGKGFVVSCFLIWATHVLLCLKNPAVYLGQANGENLDIIAVAYNVQQAKTVLFFKTKQRLKASPWFINAIAKLAPDVDPQRYFKESGGYVNADNIIFPGNIRLWCLPATDAAEGKNPILWATDEIAAFSSETKKHQAAKIHKILRSSARTRFLDRWKGFHISYPRHGGDYLMHMLGQVQRGLLPNVYAVVRPTWEVHPNVTRESLQGDYLSDPEGSQCAYECRPPAAVDAFFRSPEYLALHASGAPPALLKELLDVEDGVIEKIAALGQDPIRETDLWGDPVLDRHGFPKLHRWFRGQKSPAGDRYEYFAHLDPGLSGDAFGFAMGHLHHSPQGIYPVIDLAFRWTGRQFKDFGEVRRVGWFGDTVDQEEAIAAAEVDFRTVREFLFYLNRARGFDFGLVTMDNWNSAESVQELRKRDIPVGNHIVRKQDYDEFKSLVYGRNLQFYGWPILVNESRKLQLVNGTRVEAPRTSAGAGAGADSHKDVSDAVAAVCWRLVRLKDETTEFYTFDAPQDIWERAKREQKPVQVDQLPEDASEAQRRIFEQFLSEDAWLPGL